MSFLIDVRLFLLGLGGFFWGGLVTPIAIRLARHYRILDLPDARKIHTIQMPRGAGLVLWTGYLLWGLYAVGEGPYVRLTALGATIVFLVGYCDDMCSLSPFLRLALHLTSAALAVLPLRLPFLTAAACTVWTAGLTSAYNLIDGVNGLCLSLFIASSTGLAFLGSAPAGVVMAAMALGVLCWNFPSARTFLGDGGSTLLGYLFAVHFLYAATPTLRSVGLNELILLLLLFGGMPVLDTMIAFSRRILRGRSPFYPDKGHLHHRLMELTGSPFWSVFCLWLMQSASLAGGIAVYARLS